jgi:MFS family permease
MFLRMSEKRKLPVLRGPSSDDDETRPGWHWMFFGAVSIFVAWVPLAFAAQWLTRGILARFATESPEALRDSIAQLPASERWRVMASLIVPHLGGLAIACVAGGYLVGRYGPSLGPREAAMAGALSGLVAVALASTGGISAGFFVLPMVAGGFSALGGRFGRHRRLRA